MRNIHPMVTRLKAGIHKPKLYNTIASSPLPTKPTFVKAALESPLWREAMHNEYDALIRNNPWELVPCNRNENIIGANGCSKLSLSLMAHWNVARHVL